MAAARFLPFLFPEPLPSRGAAPRHGGGRGRPRRVRLHPGGAVHLRDLQGGDSEPAQVRRLQRREEVPGQARAEPAQDQAARRADVRLRDVQERGAAGRGRQGAAGRRVEGPRSGRAGGQAQGRSHGEETAAGGGGRGRGAPRQADRRRGHPAVGRALRAAAGRETAGVRAGAAEAGQVMPPVTPPSARRERGAAGHRAPPAARGAAGAGCAARGPARQEGPPGPGRAVQGRPHSAALLSQVIPSLLTFGLCKWKRFSIVSLNPVDKVPPVRWVRWSLRHLP